MLRLREQLRQILEYLTDVQLSVTQPKRSQTSSIECMADLARMLQNQHPGTTFKIGYQRTETMAQWTLAT